MPPLKIVKPKDLIRFLEQQGFVQIRQSGSHVFLRKGHETTIVPLHASDLGRGMIRKILRDTDLSVQVYEENV